MLLRAGPAARLAAAMPPADADIEAPRLPRTLAVAVALVSIETLAEAVFISGRSELTGGLRAMLISCVGLKWLFAWRILHRSAGAALGLLMFEATTIVAAFGSVEEGRATRVVVGATAASVIALVAASLHAFPSPSLPKA